MLNLQQGLINEKLTSIDFAGIARRSGFDNRYSKKIRAHSFLYGFLMMYSQQSHSLQAWAACIEEVSGKVVSKQALWLKFTNRHVNCFKAVFASLLSAQIRRCTLNSALIDGFGRVLVEDSSCFSVSKQLAEHFPGSRNSTGVAATARMQLCYDLKRSRFEQLDLQCYRDNDQKHAPLITRLAVKGDLVLRDLGYFALAVFDVMDKAGVFFLSRLRYKVSVYDIEKGQKLDLLELTAGKTCLDMFVLLGAEQQLRVRLVGEKLPDHVAALRRRKAKKSRHRNTNHSKHYMQCLGWNFYITNVEHWEVEQVRQTYRLRWRIEMIFKGLKSGLGWSKMFEKKPLPYNRVIMTYYLMLIYVLLCWSGFRYFAKALRYISLHKFLNWFRLRFTLLLTMTHWDDCISSVKQHCLYEKRRNRSNYYQIALS